MTQTKSSHFGVIIMESKTNNWEKQFDNEVIEVIKCDDEDATIEFSLEEWEPDGLVVEFEPDEELQIELDLDDDQVIEIELEPLPN